MKKIIMASMILICCVTSISSDAAILEEDFETGINGQSFPDWSWPSEQVITSSGIDGKSLMIYRSAPSLGNWGISSPIFEPTHALIEFNLMIDTPSVFHTETDTAHGAHNPEGVAFYSDGSIGVGSPAGGLSTTATWTSGQAFTLGVLSLADEFFVYIDGTEIANVQRSSQYSNLPIESFFFTYGAGGNVSPGTIMIDNVLVTPEPATLALVGLGAFLIRRKRHG